MEETETSEGGCEMRCRVLMGLLIEVMGSDVRDQVEAGGVRAAILI